MSIRVVINTPYPAADLIEQYGAGAKVYLLSSTTEDGTYTSAVSEALVSGTEQYELYDTAGSSTTWYKAQFGSSDGTELSSESDAFQTGQLAAYASLDDLREVLALGSNTAYDNMLADLLTDVSDDLDGVCQRRFYRDPQVSGTTTVYADIVRRGCSSLADAMDGPFLVDGRTLDIVSVTSLWVRDSETASYVEVAAGDTGYYLEGISRGVGVFGTDWPYEDVSLSPAGTYTAFPTGKRAVKIIGAFGFPTVPNPVKRAVISECAERFRQKISGGSQPIGVNQFGTPIFLTGDSPDFRRVTRWPYSRRAMAA